MIPKNKQTKSPKLKLGALGIDCGEISEAYSTVTAFAKLRGWSTSVPLINAT